MRRNKRYNLLASVYDLSMALAERALAQHRQELMVHARGRVLEIGVGTGAMLPYYPPGCHVFGIDTSSSMLRRAARKAAQLGLEFTPLIMDAQRLGFLDGYFDTVTSSLVLCSVDNPRRTLCEMKRVLRPRGKALLVEHVRPAGTLGVVFDAANVVWSPLVCQLNRQTESLVEWAGFDMVHQRTPVSFLRIMQASPRRGDGACEERSKLP